MSNIDDPTHKALPQWSPVEERLNELTSKDGRFKWLSSNLQKPVFQDYVPFLSTGAKVALFFFGWLGLDKHIFKKAIQKSLIEFGTQLSLQPQDKTTTKIQKIFIEKVASFNQTTKKHQVDPSQFHFYQTISKNTLGSNSLYVSQDTLASEGIYLSQETINQAIQAYQKDNPKKEMDMRSFKDWVLTSTKSSFFTDESIKLAIQRKEAPQKQQTTDQAVKSTSPQLDQNVSQKPVLQQSESRSSVEKPSENLKNQVPQDTNTATFSSKPAASKFKQNSTSPSLGKTTHQASTRSLKELEGLAMIKANRMIFNKDDKNRISADEIETLLHAHPEIDTLDFTNCESWIVSAHVSKLEKFPTVKHLVLSGCPRANSRPFLTYIANNKHLQSAVLIECGTINHKNLELFINKQVHLITDNHAQLTDTSQDSSLSSIDEDLESQLTTSIFSLYPRLRPEWITQNFVLEVQRKINEKIQNSAHSQERSKKTHGSNDLVMNMDAWKKLEEEKQTAFLTQVILKNQKFYIDIGESFQYLDVSSIINEVSPHTKVDPKILDGIIKKIQKMMKKELIGIPAEELHKEAVILPLITDWEEKNLKVVIEDCMSQNKPLYMQLQNGLFVDLSAILLSLSP